MKTLLKNAARRMLKLPLIGPVVAGLFARLAARPLISKYLHTHEVRKLHLGGSGLPDWLNSDLCPSHWKIVRLNATQTFPLPDASFSFVFSEHMIEHVPVAGARRMLTECHRVLRPGGRIRLATPDLARVVQIHAATDPTNQDYLRWAIAHNRLPADLPADAVVINSLFHDHGHQFLYDEPTLAALLRATGFEDVRRYAPGESDQPELAGLEMHHHVIGHAANNFETLVLEARKP
ncbi:MAG TPA: methyltransferase domain-containing protein [Opitutaceae bacterium]|jgi:predicted SAM-dependent methyltransferase|nr:methyltransferase domain-containing protein [Opitutaceae bacterium]